MTPRPSPPPLYPIHTDAEARALLHGAGACLGSEVLRVTLPHTTPLMDLIRAGQRLGFEVTGEGGRAGVEYRLVMRRAKP
jgi:hypothetical protein